MGSIVLIGIDASRAIVAQRTGTEAYSLHLVRALLDEPTSHRFRLYLNAAPPAGLLPASSRCELRVIPFPRLWTHVRLSAEMLRDPPDLLFVPSHVLPLAHPRCSVVTVHDLGHRHYPEAHTATQRWYLEWSTRYHVRSAAHLIADSEATEADLVRFYGADPKRVTVSYLGVDPTLHPIRDSDLLSRVRRKYGIEGPYLLYVGTLQPRKNLVRLIEAFATLVQRGAVDSRLTLVLAGKRGWMSEGLLAKAEEAGIAGRVHLAGYVDERDLAALYSGATLFVIASLYEGFCLPVLEAMACGTPVACSNTSSLPEVVGDAALTFDPHDVEEMVVVMGRLLANGNLRAELVARGHERCARFTWGACARQVMRVLERVAGAPLRERTFGDS
ncbi:MAG: glycosyltransferase family 4 protein [Anaerolineae bacterium]